MQNDPSAPGAPPSRGFASIITLVSDVSKDLAALEQTPAAPPPPRVTPSPTPPLVSPPPSRRGAPSHEDWTAPQPQQWTAPAYSPQWAGLRQPRSNEHRPNVPPFYNSIKPEPTPQEEPAWFYMLIAFIIFMFVILLIK